MYFSCIEKEKSYSETQTNSDGKVTMEVNYHKASHLLESLEKNHFDVLSVFRIDYQKPNGISDVHLVIIAQKKN